MNKSTVHLIFLWAAVLAAGSLLANAASAGGRAADERLLQYSIVGSSSCDRTPCFNGVMVRIPVQRFLLELAEGPMARAKAEARDLGAAGIADLLKLRLVRFDGDRYLLNFALFTAADVGRIREVSERYAGSLAEALLARRADIETALRAYDVPGVDPGSVAYFLLGCVSLDWDGLAVTDEKKYRKTTEERFDGSYVPAAEELGETSLEKIYWGSHYEEFSGVHFTSFGDHHALPRMLFPDLLWNVPGLSSRYPEAVRNAHRELLSDSLRRGGAKIGRMMLALREGPKAAGDLARAAGTDEDESRVFLRLLSVLEYVREKDGWYETRIPVLTGRDAVMTAELRAIGRRVMEQWLAGNYDRLAADLDGLSFTRSGVPFSEGFTMIWHYLFGIVNRKLVEAGLFADPYEPGRAFKGALPAVCDLDL
ncbi:MAG: hypothetical protein PHE62_12435 [Acidobacteriota bacterium]|nr:hypothetical protein [Acidobacteriota bacterium]